MIAPGRSRGEVGVSGGKDSLLLLYALSLYRKFEHKNFELRGIMLDGSLKPWTASCRYALGARKLNLPFDA